jgi:hypothetical protein
VISSPSLGYWCPPAHQRPCTCPLAYVLSQGHSGSSCQSPQPTRRHYKLGSRIGWCRCNFSTMPLPLCFDIRECTILSRGPTTLQPSFGPTKAQSPPPTQPLRCYANSPTIVDTTDTSLSATTCPATSIMLLTMHLTYNIYPPLHYSHILTLITCRPMVGDFGLQHQNCVHA